MAKKLVALVALLALVCGAAAMGEVYEISDENELNFGRLLINLLRAYETPSDADQAAIESVLNAIGAMNPTDREVAEAIADQFPDTSIDLLEKVMARHRQCDAWTATPVMEQQALERLETVMEHAGELTRQQWVDFDRLVDNSFAEKAAQN